MANKEFQVRHGLLVNNTVLVANTITTNVGIGRSDPGYRLDIVGTINASSLLINGATLSTDYSPAFIQANTARSHANAAFLQANAAYDAANTKLSTSGGTITGDLSIVGNLYLSGNSQFQNVSSLVIGDPLIYLAANNYSSDIVDIGFIANYVNATGSNVHTGLYREHENKMYYLFQGYDKEPINNHIGALSNNMTLAVLNADIVTSNLNLAGANVILSIAAGNTYAQTVGAAGNTYTREVGTAGNNYTNTVGTAGNNYTNTVGAAGNTYTELAFNKANGAAQLAFSTVVANGNNITASTNASTLRIVAGTNMAITTEGSNITLTSTTTGGDIGPAFNQANAAYDAANTKLANTSGVTFAGNLTITGNVGIGTAQTSNFALEVNGAFAATTKSFLIPHPTKEGMQLRYASLEGPENGVYVRGKSYNNTIELPDYWTGLVDEDTITVHLTPFGRQQNLYVWRVANNVVYVEGSDNLSYYYSVWAERKDVVKLIVEF